MSTKSISHRSVLAIIATFLLISVPNFSQPHIVGGTVRIKEQGAPPNATTHFKCYLVAHTGSPKDTLSELSSDCGYEDGYYWVQTNNFNNPWTAGLTFHIDLWETEGGGSTAGETILSNNALDSLDLTILDASLPVTLFALNAKPTADGILIQWSTQCEVDNLGFILERRNSADTKWQTVASYRTHESLAGQGSTSSMTDYAYLDRMAEPGQSYQYRLSDVNSQERPHVIDVIEVTMPEFPIEAGGIEAQDLTELSPPYPNPFNPTTRIRYRLSEPSLVELTIYDIRGNRVDTLIREEQNEGSYAVYWHGRDSQGFAVPSGTYMLVLQTPDQIQNQRAILLR
jgi:hypothetical protein